MEDKFKLIKGQVVFVGAYVSIRTLNNIYVGKIEKFNEKNLWLKSAVVDYDKITSIKLIGGEKQ